MTKTISHAIRCLLVLACVLACQTGTRAEEVEPTFEELRGLIGKYKGDLEKKFGPAESDKMGVFPLPHDQAPVRVLMYGDVGVVTNKRSKIIDVSREAFEIYTPPKPTFEGLSEFIDEDRGDLEWKFGPPDEVKTFAITSFGEPPFRIESFLYEQPTRIHVYGDFGVCINGFGDILEIRREISGDFVTEKPTLETLSEFIGKSERDLMKKFGFPRSLSSCSCGVPPEGTAEEDICGTTYSLWYDDFFVEIYTLDRTVADVTHKSEGSSLFSPSLEKLKTFIGKTEDDLNKRFGRSYSITTHLPSDPPVDATEEETKAFFEREPVRLHKYGKFDVWANIHGVIVEIRTVETRIGTTF